MKKRYSNINKANIQAYKDPSEQPKNSTTGAISPLRLQKPIQMTKVLKNSKPANTRNHGNDGNENRTGFLPRIQQYDKSDTSSTTTVATDTTITTSTTISLSAADADKNMKEKSNSLYPSSSTTMSTGTTSTAASSSILNSLPSRYGTSAVNHSAKYGRPSSPGTTGSSLLFCYSPSHSGNSCEDEMFGDAREKAQTHFGSGKFPFDINTGSNTSCHVKEEEYHQTAHNHSETGGEADDRILIWNTKGNDCWFQEHEYERYKLAWEEAAARNSLLHDEDEDDDDNGCINFSRDPCDRKRGIRVDSIQPEKERKCPLDDDTVQRQSTNQKKVKTKEIQHAVRNTTPNREMDTLKRGQRPPYTNHNTNDPSSTVSLGAVTDSSKRVKDRPINETRENLTSDLIPFSDASLNSPHNRENSDAAGIAEEHSSGNLPRPVGDEVGYVSRLHFRPTATLFQDISVLEENNALTRPVMARRKSSLLTAIRERSRSFSKKMAHSCNKFILRSPNKRTSRESSMVPTPHIFNATKPEGDNESTRNTCEIADQCNGLTQEKEQQMHQQGIRDSVSNRHYLLNMTSSSPSRSTTKDTSPITRTNNNEYDYEERGAENTNGFQSFDNDSKSSPGIAMRRHMSDPAVFFRPAAVRRNSAYNKMTEDGGEQEEEEGEQDLYSISSCPGCEISKQQSLNRKLCRNRSYHKISEYIGSNYRKSSCKLSCLRGSQRSLSFCRRNPSSNHLDGNDDKSTMTASVVQQNESVCWTPYACHDRPLISHTVPISICRDQNPLDYHGMSVGFLGAMNPGISSASAWAVSSHSFDDDKRHEGKQPVEQKRHKNSPQSSNNKWMSLKTLLTRFTEPSSITRINHTWKHQNTRESICKESSKATMQPLLMSNITTEETLKQPLQEEKEARLQSMAHSLPKISAEMEQRPHTRLLSEKTRSGMTAVRPRGSSGHLQYIDETRNSDIDDRGTQNETRDEEDSIIKINDDAFIAGKQNESTHLEGWFEEKRGNHLGSISRENQKRRDNLLFFDTDRDAIFFEDGDMESDIQRSACTVSDASASSPKDDSENKARKNVTFNFFDAETHEDRNSVKDQIDAEPGTILHVENCDVGDTKLEQKKQDTGSGTVEKENSCGFVDEWERYLKAFGVNSQLLRSYLPSLGLQVIRQPSPMNEDNNHGAPLQDDCCAVSSLLPALAEAALLSDEDTEADETYFTCAEDATRSATDPFTGVESGSGTLHS